MAVADGLDSGPPTWSMPPVLLQMSRLTMTMTTQKEEDEDEAGVSHTVTV